MKSIKTKVAVGVITTGLLAGMGTAFAGTDAGTQFKTWYGKVFVTSSAKVSQDVQNTYQAKLGAYNTEFNALKASSAKGIVDSTTAKSTEAMKAINAAKNDYVAQVNNAKTSIDVQRDFEVFTQTFNSQVVDKTKNAAKAYGEKDLKNTLDKQGTDSVTKINSDVAGYKASSTADLTKQIKDAQDAINKLVAQYSQEADSNIRTHIEAKIVELRNDLTQYAAALVVAKQADVTAAATKAQTEALDALDAIAASINK